MNITQQEIEDWVLTQSDGAFHYTKIKDGIIDRKLYGSLRTIMHRMREKGLAYPVLGRDGWWRKADLDLQEERWWDRNGDGESDSITFPLGINKYAHLPRPALVLVAGLYNQGKTAFCLNIIKLNMDKWKDNIFLFASEGLEQLSWKFKKLLPLLEKPPPFKTYRRFDNFADVIVPDGLNIIDYLRTDMDKPYTVTNKLLEINKKLSTGVAVVAMQKPPGRRIAFGGASTGAEPTLYLSIDKGYLEFEKIKAPKLLDSDPYHTRINFTISQGVNFVEGDTIVE